MDDVFRGIGVEVEALDRPSFLKIKETLTRIGVPSKRDQTLYQSCHILHKRGRYAIVHFKEMIALDGRETDFDDEDKARRNTIAALLQQWKLLKVLRQEDLEPKTELKDKIKVLDFSSKSKWTLVPKYKIGKK